MLKTIAFATLSVFLLSSPLLEAEAKKKANEAQEIDVDAIKKKYWAKGRKAELGVVQDRLFSKQKKIQIGGFGGVLFSDPFLTVNPVGGLVGYHFNEFLSLNVIGMTFLVDSSTALDTFKQEKEGTVNTNEPQNYLGLEANGSFIYGKLSLLGKKIIYYDMHFALGGGSVGTESGRFLSPSIGLGQRFFLTKALSLRLDYRALRYTEDIKEKEVTNKLGQVVGSRTNFSHMVTLGVDILFSIGGSK